MLACGASKYADESPETPEPITAIRMVLHVLSVVLSCRERVQVYTVEATYVDCYLWESDTAGK
jgi:hypothetical protein